MSRPRINIAGLMGIVLFAAVGFAAIRNANEVWAQTTFTIAFVAMLVAILGAIAFSGETRMAWAGFAVFAWGRFMIETQTQFFDHPEEGVDPERLRQLGGS
jgi:hypothetical protein